jgi:hypothetical protein
MKEEEVAAFNILWEDWGNPWPISSDILPHLIVQRHARNSHEDLSDHESLKKYEINISEKSACWWVKKRTETMIVFFISLIPYSFVVEVHTFFGFLHNR